MSHILDLVVRELRVSHERDFSDLVAQLAADMLPEEWERWKKSPIKTSDYSMVHFVNKSPNTLDNVGEELDHLSALAGKPFVVAVDQKLHENIMSLKHGSFMFCVGC